jgi:hypothetical protein
VLNDTASLLLFLSWVDAMTRSSPSVCCWLFFTISANIGWVIGKLPITLNDIENTDAVIIVKMTKIDFVINALDSHR